MKSLMKDVSLDELMSMRDGGMTNRDIANALGISTATVYRYLGAQPQGSRKRRYCTFDKPAEVHKDSDCEEPEEAALIVENRTIGLAGLFAGYRVDVKSKSVIVFVEDDVDALVVPFEQVENFAKELRAISKHIDGLKIGVEAW